MHTAFENTKETGKSNPTDNSSDFYAAFPEGIRGYAPYFSLSTSRQDNEVEVVSVLSEQMMKQKKEYFHSIVPRGQGNDPPDCEARGINRERIGIEVTELVDGDSIATAKKGESISQGNLSPHDVIETISTIIARKDSADVKGGPYDQYILIIYCDDPLFLDYEILEAIRKAQFDPTSLIDRAYFLESYCPWEKCCPYIELRLDYDLE